LTLLLPSMQQGADGVLGHGGHDVGAAAGARGFTGRAKLIKMDGAYHGHADSLLVAAGSGAATLGLPGTAGVTEGAARDTLTVGWNDAAAIEALFREAPQQQW
jgi:glutamate-1-semialdehyde 2,1-aminomutase